MKFKSLLVALLILLIVSGCGTKYEDTNGDDNYQLQTITDDMFFGSFQCSSDGGTSSELLGVRKISYKRIDGIMDIDTFDKPFNADTLDIKISFHITKGNGKLIICTWDKELHEIKINKDDQEFSVDLADAPICLRIAGEALECKIEYYVYFREK